MNVEATVLAAVMAMTAGLENGDIDAVMATYEGGAAVVFEPGAPVSDAQAMRQIFTDLSALQPDISYAAGHEVIVAGDIAVHLAPWSMTGMTPDGDPIEQEGLSVAVLRRQTDGTWKLVIDNPHGSHLLVK